MKIFNALNAYLLLTLCGALGELVSQPDSFKTVKLGDTLTVRCYFPKTMTLQWYKQGPSRRMESFLGGKTGATCSLETSQNVCTLKIPNVSWKDAGTYYCGVLVEEKINFGLGTLVVVEGDSKPIQSVLQSPGFIQAQPGDSVTLSCSFNISHCPQEHTRVTWIRSGSAYPKYVSCNTGNDAIACEERDGEEEMTCVDDLKMKNISSTEEGTYLCVVNVCGDTWPGSGTRIELSAPVQISPVAVALIVVSVAYGVTVLIMVAVICKICKKQSREMDHHSHGSPQDNEVEDGVTYAQVKVRPRSAPCRPPKPQHSPHTVIYAKVRNRQME